MKFYLRFLELLTYLVSVALFLTLLPLTASAAGEWNVCFGHLHGHSGHLDTLGSAAEVFEDARKTMDFFGLTDFSHSFQEDTWESGKEEARQASAQSSFAALYGYEITSKTNPRFDHIAVFGSGDYLDRNQPELKDVTDVYAALVSQPGAVGMFCHPDPLHGDFSYFQPHRWDWDQQMALLEVIGEQGETFYEGYQAALDAGWHVAPTANGASHQGSWGTVTQARTGILADSLEEESLLEAIRARRVYATTNPELQITYRLGGHIMGSRVLGLECYQATVTLSDPSGLVQVIGKEGTVVASCEAAGELTIEVPPGQPFYYLRILDGDEIAAVTAPVWIEEISDFGSTDLTASNPVPVQGESVTFSFTLFNHEPGGLAISALRLLADGDVIWEQAEALTLAPGEEMPIAVPYIHNGVGVTGIFMEAAGTLDGRPVTIRKELELSFRPAILNAHILVDGRHCDIQYHQLKNLTSLAAEADMDVGIFRHETPEGAKILVVPAPDRDFEEDYPQSLQHFVETGGVLILCGSAGDNDRLNTLLAQMGSTLRFHHDAATDPVHNGGIPQSLHPDILNREELTGLPEGAYYTQLHGCTIDPGLGTWLAMGKDTMEAEGRVLLARESLGNGQIIAAGSCFLDDEHMALCRNPWDIPRVNQLFLESLLELERIRLPQSDIQEVRRGTPGQLYRVTGYVTAGTSDPNNRFPGMIYLQDGTGGIGVTAFQIPDVEIGFCLDITGQLHWDGENPALKLVSCRILENHLYRHDPAVSPNETAMDYVHHGGELMLVEGVVRQILYTPDGEGVRLFSLEDGDKACALVRVEDYILSGAFGENTLSQEVIEEEYVRACGILHLEDDGTPVLRVRNCDEVVSIPPIPERPRKSKGNADLSNPNTSDPFARFFTFLQF